LKEALKRRRLSVSGRKAELVDRLKEVEGTGAVKSDFGALRKGGRGRRQRCCNEQLSASLAYFFPILKEYYVTKKPFYYI